MRTEIKGTMISFKRFEIHDGDGIRTTLFLKGCPLRCKWCHNPESFLAKPTQAYYEDSCKHCGRCVRVCEQGAIIIDDKGVLHYDLDRCNACGACENACPADARLLYGKSITVEQAFRKLIQDKPFYDKSGGGVTLSGGEPLMQPEFCRALLQKLKEHGINTAIDTCGFVSRQALDAVLPYTDTFLYDVKAYHKDVHIRATGQSNQIILDNLRYLDQMGKNVEIRIPLIPGYNDGELGEIAAFLATLTCVRCVKVLPYHDFAQNKYTAIGMADQFVAIPCPDEEQLAQARAILRKKLPTVRLES